MCGQWALVKSGSLDVWMLCHLRAKVKLRMVILAGELSLSCARLMDGCLTTLWVKRHYQSTNKANSACHSSGVV